MDDAAERFGHEAQVEYLCGLALALESPYSHGLAGPDEVHKTIQVLEKLFQAERALVLSEEAERGRRRAGR